MKRRLIFLFLLGGLVLLGAYVFFDSEQGWTTISQSNSARKDWYLNNYQPGLNLKMRTLNSKQLKNTEGGSAKQELSGTGYADFTMVYETRYNPQIERTYFKVRIVVNDKGDVDTEKSSMAYWKTEEEEKDDPPID